jgi:hypothetical protein
MGDTLGGKLDGYMSPRLRSSAGEAQRLDLGSGTCSADVPPAVPTPLLLRDTRREVARGSDNSSGHRCHRRPVVDRRSGACVRVRRWLQMVGDLGDNRGDRETGKRVTAVTVTERDHDTGDMSAAWCALHAPNLTVPVLNTASGLIGCPRARHIGSASAQPCHQS